MSNQPARSRKSRPVPPTIGWREWTALPELGIDRVKAKVDTGARSSSLHAIDVEIEEVGDESWVEFAVHPKQRSARETVRARARMIDRRWVKSSGGHRTLRPVIRTIFVVAGVSFEADLTLVSRDAMGFRMLLGREALRKRFLVDSSRSYLGDKSEAE
ncbi:MAG: RimK/LysX family protein [Phycisphaeraceae bacterium]|nr:RimK/LysX family protein [Phycisphaeraceae bacterium]